MFFSGKTKKTKLTTKENELIVIGTSVCWDFSVLSITNIETQKWKKRSGENFYWKLPKYGILYKNLSVFHNFICKFSIKLRMYTNKCSKLAYTKIFYCIFLCFTITKLKRCFRHLNNSSYCDVRYQLIKCEPFRNNKTYSVSLANWCFILILPQLNHTKS